MPVFSSTISIADPGPALDRGRTPPPHRGGGNGGDNRDDYGSPGLDLRLRRARLGLLVGLAGILMVFISFTSAYIVRQGLPTLDPRTNSLVHDWLPVRLPGILLANTFVLLISSLTMEMARRRATHSLEPPRTTFAHELLLGGPARILWLTLTLLLGLAFLRGQWLAWRQLTATGFGVASSPSSSFVYVLTGMHGLHLLGGILALLVVGAAGWSRRSIESQAVVLDVTGWYWHSMALLWIYILCLLKFVR
jgi:cytochrome c oxidase subunit 3